MDASLTEPVYTFFALIAKPDTMKAIELKTKTSPGIRIREWGLGDDLSVKQSDLHLRMDRVALAPMGVEAVSSKKTTQQMIDDKTCRLHVSGIELRSRRCRQHWLRRLRA